VHSIFDNCDLAELHLSEVNTASRRDPVSLNAVSAFQSIAAEIPEKIPVILEALIDSGQSTIEAIERARCSIEGDDAGYGIAVNDGEHAGFIEKPSFSEMVADGATNLTFLHPALNAAYNF